MNAAIAWSDPCPYWCTEDHEGEYSAPGWFLTHRTSVRSDAVEIVTTGEEGPLIAIDELYLSEAEALDVAEQIIATVERLREIRETGQ